VALAALAASVGMFALAPLASNASTTPVPLGDAASFAVLGGSTVTNTGSSVIDGNVGLSPGSSVTGFPPGNVNDGSIHVDDAVASGGELALTAAYGDAASAASTATLTTDLASRTLTPGVYTATSLSPSIGLNGTLTLNAEGNANAVFIFQAASTLLVGSGSDVVLTGGAQACNVFWEVGSSATVGTGASFVGNILALDSITMDTGASLVGRALTQTAAVTLDSNVIKLAKCASAKTGASGSSGSSGRSGSGGGGTGSKGSPGSKPAHPARPAKKPSGFTG
jgi:hypothetical protein